MSTLPATQLTEASASELSKPPYERFAISMPAAMAEDIRALCQRESRSHSEFFREAVRAFMLQRPAQVPPVLQAVSTHSEISSPSSVRAIRPVSARDDAFADFTEWAEDKVYNALSNPQNKG